MEKRATNMLIKKLVSLESESMYSETEKMGMVAKLVLNRSQIKGLQNIAYASNKTVDIFDFIKNQTGKDHEKKNWAKNNFGTLMLEKLTGLSSRRTKLVQKLQEQNIEPDDFIRHRIHLDLCREFIKHTAAQYHYGMEVQGS